MRHINAQSGIQEYEICNRDIFEMQLLLACKFEIPVLNRYFLTHFG